MTTEEAKARVEKIRVMATDNEAAHSEEDSFHRAVLYAIANGEAADPTALAAVALETASIIFCRWCA